MELDQRQDYLNSLDLESIYLGGGTPSLLDQQDLLRLFDEISKKFTWSQEAEITLEANPDDLTPAKILQLKGTPINRLSIGIQSFDDSELSYMNRSHNSEMAHQCLSAVRDAGFDRLTVDLIYGSVLSDDFIWSSNLQQLIRYDIPHFSAYALTVESKTPLAYQISKGLTSAPDDDQVAKHFLSLQEFARISGYQHYEISNFALEGHIAIHNSNYWKGKPYMGIGPSAHSFDGHTRSWNVASNPQYIRSIQEGTKYSETEVLSPQERYNEYVMTGLRTMWGCELTVIKSMSSEFAGHFETEVRNLIACGVIEQTGSVYCLTDQGKLFADRVASDLFIIP